MGKVRIRRSFTGGCYSVRSIHGAYLGCLTIKDNKWIYGLNPSSTVAEINIAKQACDYLNKHSQRIQARKWEDSATVLNQALEKAKIDTKNNSTLRFAG